MPLTIGTQRALLRSGGINWLLRDYFMADRAAGSVSGTAAEPGPGTRVVLDTGNNLSITGGRTVSAGIAGAGDPRFGYSDAIARVPGRTFKWTIQYVANRGHSGVCTSATPTSPIYGIYENGGVLNTIDPAQVGYIVAATGADYVIWVALFATGAAIWMQGGGGAYIYTNPTLLFVTGRYNTTPLYLFPQIARAIDCQIQTDNIEVWDVPALNSRQAIATVYQATPANGVNYTTTADALHSLHFTLPGGPAGGDRIGIHYRQQDATNYFDAYVEYNGGTTVWDFKLDVVTAGVPANLITAAGIGTPDELLIIVSGNEHWCFTAVASSYTIRGAKQTDASFNTATEVGAWFDSGTVALLESFARTWSM